jgi:S-adenosylmethionine:tRNA ribosyltransferase-isomerase
MLDSLENYLFELPPELIAQNPSTARDASRMMLVDRQHGTIAHSSIREITAFLKKDDVLVLNNTKVMPCRLMGRRKTGGRVEMLFIKELNKSPLLWEAMLKPMHRLKEQEEFHFLSAPHYTVRLIEKLPSGRAILQLNIDIPVEKFFESYGLPPLPPYIKRDYTRYDAQTLLADKQRYQTIYAENPGSVAAPTAGLHFSDKLLHTLEENGIAIARITLHVGPGTFIPISTRSIKEHQMESELYEIRAEAAEKINHAKENGRRVIAVGSTVVRTIETAGRDDGKIVPSSGSTNLFIHPPFEFKIIDGMLTNFHLPGSTLLVMVAALAGYELIMNAYREAIKAKYRFFSFGDCMLIL